MPSDSRRLQQFVAQPAAQFVGEGEKLQVFQGSSRACLSGKAAEAPGDAGPGILRLHGAADDQEQVALQQALQSLPRRFVPQLELPPQ
jgi:hypothetical protein